MRIKEEKYYLTLNGRQLSLLIEYLTGARNNFLDKNIPTDDVDNAISLHLLCTMQIIKTQMAIP